MKRFAIIVAGGQGKRMGNAIPKQFLLLNGKPIIFHTIEKFLPLVQQLVLVLPKDQIDYFRQLQDHHKVQYKLTIAEGGPERFHSVQNGLALISEAEGLVAIHDAVRPLIAPALVLRSFETAQTHFNSIVAVPSKDSIRHVVNHTSRAVPRDEYYLIQTPQTFDLAMLRKAYDVPYDQFTDDASVFERAGYTIHLIEGSYANIKITTPEDLLIAETLLKAKS